MQEVRESFDRGDRHPGCGQCWRTEDQGHQSLRQRTLGEQQEWQASATTGAELVAIEFSFSNLCNLRCLMCNEVDSSAILTENHLLGIAVRSQRELDWSDHNQHLRDLVDQGHIRWINVVGGEPFMDSRLRQWLADMPQHRAREIRLHIPTNCTQWNPAWLPVLERFERVRLMFSLDAVGDLAHYMRYPSDWNTVQSNIHSMRQLANGDFMVSAVVQNLNVGHLGDLILWCRDQDLWLTPVALVDPDPLHMTNLPYPALGWATSHILHLREQGHAPNIQQFLEQTTATLMAARFDEHRWQRFLDHVEPRDQHRGLTWRRWIPVG
jgi:organic radical activating enzyme